MELKNKLINKDILLKIKNFFVKDIKMKLLVAYIIANIIYLLVGSYLFITNKISFNYKNYSLGMIKFLEYNFIVFLVIIFEKKYKKNLLHIGILISGIIGFISTVFAIDKNIALNGCEGRYEGLFIIFYYLSLVLLASFVSSKYKKVIINCILLCGIIQALYAICQSFNLLNVKKFSHMGKYYDIKEKKEIYGNWIWIVGLTNNPNFFGTYILMCLSYSFGLLIDSKKKITNIIYGLLIALFMFALLLANSASSIIGLIIVSGILLVYCLIKEKYIKLITLFIIIILITCFTVKIGKTSLFYDLHIVSNEAVQVAKGDFNDNYGTKRMYIWKNTVKIIPKYLLHGVGIDCFGKAFDGESLTRKTDTKIIVYDKAHNEYLQILITQGIFGLCSYLFIFGYTIFKGIKNGFKNNKIYLVLPVIGYVVQAFFNISVIEVAPIFYLALGLCCENTINKKEINKV